MSKDRYIRLIEEFCRLSKLDQPARIVEGGAVDFDGVPFSLLYSAKINPGALLIYCEFGTPPLGREADAYRILLQMNFSRYDGNGGQTFTLSPATGKILCASRLNLEQAKAQELHDLLAKIAEQAKQWRQEYRMGVQPLPDRALHHARRPGRFSNAGPQR